MHSNKQVIDYLNSFDPDWWVDVENDAVRKACRKMDDARKEAIGVAATEAQEDEIDAVRDLEDEEARAEALFAEGPSDD